MKLLKRLTMAALGTAALFTINTLNQVAAAVKFDQTEIDQSRVVAIAVPRAIGYQLLILEQVANSRPCWSESGSSPVKIDPLLVNFDFTGICGRATDSNGYSIRMAGNDLALKYSLNLQNTGNDVVLVGSPISDPSLPPIVIGKTHGITNDMMKIDLDPNWRFAKRAYDGKTLGHFYLASNQAAPGTSNSGNETPATNKFPDIANDVYAKEIDEAVSLGFVAGFNEDNTFRPQGTLTREQLVSLVLESLKRIKGVTLNIPNQVASNPYPDVDTSRWSAAKIQFARDNKIVSGYQDGTFKPNQPVTRAELMAVLRRAAEYGMTLQGQTPTVVPKQPVKDFADTQGHWASSLITQMSGYCSVASPLNETGNRFYPDEGTKRNYAAAATLRMLKCVSPQP